MRAALGERGAPLGRLLLLGQAGRRGLRLNDIPPGFPRELGLAMDQVWGLRQRALRLEVINEVTALMATTLPLERIYRTVAAGVGRLVEFDGLGITLLDFERGELRVLDVAARTTLSELHDRRIPMGNTLADWWRSTGCRDGSMTSTTRPCRRTAGRSCYGAGSGRPSWRRSCRKAR